MQYTEWEKPDPEGCTLYDPTYRTENRPLVAKEHFGVIEMFYISIVMKGTRMCLSKNRTPKRVNLTLYNLHLYKADFKKKRIQYLYPHVHSNIIHHSQKVEATQVSISAWPDKQRNEMRSIHTREYYSALKRKEILSRATMWMNLEDSMPSEIRDISQSRKRQIL